MASETSEEKVDQNGNYTCLIYKNTSFSPETMPGEL